MKPKPIGHAFTCDLKGKLFAVVAQRNNTSYSAEVCPALVEFNGRRYLPVFDDEEKLNKHLTHLGFENYTIKAILESVPFVESITENGLGIMLNPREVDGKTRWTEVFLDDGRQN